MIFLTMKLEKKVDSIAESLRNFIHVLDHGLQEINNRRQPKSRGTTQSPPKTPDHVSITIEDDLVPDLPIGTWSGWSPPTSSSICAVGYTTSVRQRHLSYSDICPIHVTKKRHLFKILICRTDVATLTAAWTPLVASIKVPSDS